MGVPQLDSCCCGCSLKTGTKIIGWLSLISCLLMVIVMGSTLVGLYYIEELPVDDTTAALREHLPALKVLTAFLIVIYTTACALSFILLLGAYQNKAQYVLIWVIVATTSVIIALALSVVQMIFIYQPLNLLIFIIFPVDLYLILVVYSYYREIKNVSTANA